MITELALTGAVYYSYRLLKKEKYYFIKMKSTTLLIGYDKFKRLIVADMLLTPHILISGLPNQGKSKLIRQILINLRNANIVIYGGFSDDYNNISYREIIDEKELNTFIDGILDKPFKRNKPLYIVLEEISTIRSKKLKDKIQELLCIARHYNIFIIGVIQIATKENCSFKDLFGVRISFKQIGEQNYRVLLGMTLEDKYRELRQKEFIMLSDRLVKGNTFYL